MKNNNTSPIAQALALNLTKRSKFAITGEQVGVQTFAEWDIAITKAYRSFYEYESARIKSIADGTDIDADATTNAFDALKGILAIVGEVNGHAITANADVLNAMTKYAIKVTRERVGDALYLYSQYSNLKKEYAAIHSGMSADYIADLEKRLTEAKEDSKLADAEFESAKTIYTRATKPAFKKAIETQMALFITKQMATPWAELEAEEEKRKEERKAKAKARRAAKRQAEAEAKAEAEA